MNADGTGQRRLTRNRGVDGSPAWSPDGRSIACGCEHDGNFDIYVMTADGRGRRRLTKSSAVDADPTWAPDGERIAFESKRDGNSEIYVVSTDAGEQRRLTRSGGSASDPARSPDGRRIAFVGNDGIYVMQVDGGFRRLTPTAGDGFPGGSPRAGSESVQP
jgi:Tol biopolymer transport system component